MGRINKIKRDLIMEANKRLLNETEVGPNLECSWFIIDTKLYDGILGELHFTEKSKGVWYLQKFTNINNPEEFEEDSFEVPQHTDIEVALDESNGKIKLVGKSLVGLEAYNKIFMKNDDEYSCNLIYSSDQYPSKYGVARSQYLIAAKIVLEESSEKPKSLFEEVPYNDGEIITFDSYYKDKKLFKKRYFYLNEESYTSFNNSLSKCDKYDTGEY